MKQQQQRRRIRIHGVPMDLGQNRRGVDMGPSALRYSGLQRQLQRLGFEVIDSGNIDVPVAEQMPDPDGRMHHAAAIGEACRRAHACMSETLNNGEFAIFLGGDHSIALGTIAAVLQQPQKTGIFWIDAHGDFNTPQTSPSGNVHGMVVSSLMGMCPQILDPSLGTLQPDQIVMLGVRDLDPEERLLLRESGIKVFTMRDIDEKGIAQNVREALYVLRGVNQLHVSFDVDSLDPGVAPGVGTPVPGGLSYREAHLLMEMLADDGRVASLDIVEVNPILDDGNLTAEIAAGMTAGLLGQNII